MKTITIKDKLWKKLTSLTVVGSLLFSFVIPPFAHAYSDPVLSRVKGQSQRESLETNQAEQFSARAESYRLTPESYKESYKLRRLLLTLRPDEAQAEVMRLAEKSISPEKLPIVLKQYRQGLKRSGIKRRSSSASRLSGTHFKISTPRSSVTHLTALHVGTFLMHIRKLHENYSVLNIPHSFAYFFRAVLDGNKDQKPQTMSRYTVSPVKADSKWEYNTKMFADEVYLPNRFWERVMKVYYEQWEVLINDFFSHKCKNGNWVIDYITKAERTIGDYLVKPMTGEESHFISEFSLVYEELINDEYDYMGTDKVVCGLYDGPGFIWDEDVFQLAYYYIKVTKLDDLNKQLFMYKKRKDENYYREGNFHIDRRYARILIEYGKKHGEEALRDLMITHAERELLAQTRVNRGGQHANYDKIHDELLEEPGQKELMEFAKKAAKDIRLGDFPDYVFLKEIIEDIVEDSQISVIPENKVGGLFGNYLMHLYITVKGRKSHTPRYWEAINEIFRMVGKDKELYLEFKSEMERSLGEEREQLEINRLTLKEDTVLYLRFKINGESLVSSNRGEDEIKALRVRMELDALRKKYMKRLAEHLAEKEREKVFYGFSVRHPKFVRVFGREMIEQNLGALLEFEKKVEEYGIKKREHKYDFKKSWRPGELSFYIFNQLFREVKDIATSENLMKMAEDIFSLMRVYRYYARYILEKTIEYFGAERAAKKLHSLVKFSVSYMPFNYIGWRVIFEGDYLRWLRPDTYRRIKKQEGEDSKKHWMQRTRENMETWYGWILFFVTLSAGSAFAYDGSSALTIWNQISHSVSSLLPYLTAGLVSVALGAPFERGTTIENMSLSPQASNALSSKKGVNKIDEIAEAVMDISQRAGDSEEVVRAILTPTLYQALSGIVQENPIRVFINRADLKEQMGSLKKLMAQNEGEKRIEPVITINRKFKEIEESEVKIELRNHGIAPNKVKIIDQPMTEDGKFSLKVLLKEYPELLEDGYSLWVLNTESWIELIYETINPMGLENGIDLVELDMKAELATESSQ